MSNEQTTKQMDTHNCLNQWVPENPIIYSAHHVSWKVSHSQDNIPQGETCKLSNKGKCQHHLKSDFHECGMLWVCWPAPKQLAAMLLIKLNWNIFCGVCVWPSCDHLPWDHVTCDQSYKCVSDPAIYVSLLTFYCWYCL